MGVFLGAANGCDPGGGRTGGAQGCTAVDSDNTEMGSDHDPLCAFNAGCFSERPGSGRMRIAAAADLQWRGALSRACVSVSAEARWGAAAQSVRANGSRN